MAGLPAVAFSRLHVEQHLVPGVPVHVDDQGFGKTEPKWQCMGKNGKIFFRNMRMKRIDAHVMRIRLAIPRWFPSGLRLEKR